MANTKLKKVPEYTPPIDKKPTYEYEYAVPSLEKNPEMLDIRKLKGPAYSAGMNTPGEAMGYQNTPGDPGTYSYQPISDDKYAEMYKYNWWLAQQQKRGHDHTYRRVRRWRNWWNRNMAQSMGFGGYEAADPLARLEQQLTEKYDPSEILQSVGSQRMGDIIDTRNQAMMEALRRQEALRGTEGLYSGVEDDMAKVRNTLVEQTMAEYDPARYQAKKQADAQMSKLLQAINAAQMEKEYLMGRTTKDKEPLSPLKAEQAHEEAKKAEARKYQYDFLDSDAWERGRQHSIDRLSEAYQEAKRRTLTGDAMKKSLL